MTALDLQRENPFATRFTRPGAIPFLFPAGVTAEVVVDRLEATNWWGQITGPHGAGKSTLVRVLEPELLRRGRQITPIALHEGQRKLPSDLLEKISSGESQLVIVDGFEQLGRWQRWRLTRLCDHRNCGLLVTAHTDVGLPLLFDVQPRLCDFAAIARALAAKTDWIISEEQLADIYARHHGNIREGLFALYDLYEQHCRTTAGTTVLNSARDSD